MVERVSPKKEAVLAIGLDKPTAHIIEAARALGHTVSRSYIQLLRHGTTSWAKVPPAKDRAAHAAPAPAPVLAAPLATDSSDQKLRAAAETLVLALGLERAHALLDDVAARIRATVASSEYG